MWNRKELKEQGKAAVKRNYWKSVLVSILFAGFFGGTGAAISSSISNNTEIQNQIQESVSKLSTEELLAIAAMLIGVIALIGICSIFIKIVLINPLEVGIDKFRINAIKDKGNISDLGHGFDVGYKRNLKTVFLRNLYIFLWTCLFIVPGIVKAYEYYMIPFLLADNPDMDRKEAFARSKAMMQGNKWKAFVLDLSFFWWYILGAITGGIVSVLYVRPYVQLTEAALYEALKKGE